MYKNHLMLKKTSPNSSYSSKKHSPIHPKYTPGTHTSRSMSIDLITTTYYISFSMSHLPSSNPWTSCEGRVKEMKIWCVLWCHVIWRQNTSMSHVCRTFSGSGVDLSPVRARNLLPQAFINDSDQYQNKPRMNYQPFLWGFDLIDTWLFTERGVGRVASPEEGSFLSHIIRRFEQGKIVV